jgi:hypothetical protein
MTTQSVFMVLLLSLIVYVSFFDTRRWVNDMRSERATTRQQPTAPTPQSAPVPATP